jgi:hypothetical protein
MLADLTPRQLDENLIIDLDPRWPNASVPPSA